MASININRYNSRYTGTNVLSVITLNIKLSHKTLTLPATNGLTCFSTDSFNLPNVRTVPTLGIQFFNVCRLLHSESLPIWYLELTFQNTIPFYIIIYVKLRYSQNLHFRICEASSTTHPTLSENSILLLTLHCVPRGIKL